MLYADVDCVPNCRAIDTEYILPLVHCKLQLAFGHVAPYNPYSGWAEPRHSTGFAATFAYTSQIITNKHHIIEILFN